MSRTDHDRLFKELLTTFFVDFIKLFLPEVANYVDPASVVFLDKEIFTDVTSGDRHEVDVVAKVKCRDQNWFFLIHLENESQARTRPRFPRRMFGYYARLLEKYDLPICPIVLFSYDAPKSEAPALYTNGLPHRQYLRFEYEAIQLNRLNWRDYINEVNPIATALLVKMNVKPAERRQVISECIRLIATLKLNIAKMQLILGFATTYLRLSAEETQFLYQQIESTEQSEREKFMEVINIWTEQGRLEGLETGLERGIKQGQQHLIMRLINHKFGNISTDLTEQLDQLSTNQLEHLAEALFDMADSTALANWLKRQQHKED